MCNTKEEVRREKLEDEYQEDKFREENQTDIKVTFKGSIWIKAVDEEEAISRAKDTDDLIDYIDEWGTE